MPFIEKDNQEFRSAKFKFNHANQKEVIYCFKDSAENTAIAGQGQEYRTFNLVFVMMQRFTIWYHSNSGM